MAQHSTAQCVCWGHAQCGAGGRVGDAGVELLLARVKDKPRQAMLRVGLATSESPNSGGVQLFWSVDDAVRATLSIAPDRARSLRVENA